MIIFPDPINPTAAFRSGRACFLNSIATASTNAVNCAGLAERGRREREAGRGGGEHNRKNLACSQCLELLALQMSSVLSSSCFLLCFIAG